MANIITIDLTKGDHNDQLKHIMDQTDALRQQIKAKRDKGGFVTYKVIFPKL